MAADVPLDCRGNFEVHYPELNGTSSKRTYPLAMVLDSRNNGRSRSSPQPDACPRLLIRRPVRGYVCADVFAPFFINVGAYGSRRAPRSFNSLPARASYRGLDNINGALEVVGNGGEVDLTGSFGDPAPSYAAQAVVCFRVPKIFSIRPGTR